MELSELIERFSHTTEDQEKGIFSELFMVGNRLQAVFDRHIPEVSLKQFMLLSLLDQSEAPPTLTHLGELLGCSRQNVKKLAEQLEKKGFVLFQKDPRDPRAVCVVPTEKVDTFFQQDFAQEGKKLQLLFQIYSPDEIETLFWLLTRLHLGIDRFERLLEEGEDTK
ncbi:MAG: MarR family winged helix-turn-helix transcriptional regulator [Faecalibacterium sp.]